MADINIRDYVVGKLQPLLPKSWLIKPVGSLPDEITTTSVVLTFQSYARNPGAPRAARIATFILTILTAKTIPGAADDDLDEHVITLLNAIDGIASTGLTWSTAERGVASNRLGFDITLSIPVQLDPVQEPS